jgi:hypothetical protein
VGHEGDFEFTDLSRPHFAILFHGIDSYKKANSITSIIELTDALYDAALDAGIRLRKGNGTKGWRDMNNTEKMECMQREITYFLNKIDTRPANVKRSDLSKHKTANVPAKTKSYADVANSRKKQSEPSHREKTPKQNGNPKKGTEEKRKGPRGPATEEEKKRANESLHAGAQDAERNAGIKRADADEQKKQTRERLAAEKVARENNGEYETVQQANTNRTTPSAEDAAAASGAGGRNNTIPNAPANAGQDDQNRFKNWPDDVEGTQFHPLFV